MDPRLSEEARAYALFAQKNFPRDATPSVEGMREHDRAIHKAVNEKFVGTFTGKHEERQIKVDEKTEIPITIYTPVGATKDKILIYFHGGGWFFGSRQTHQTILNILADETKSVCISVEYRLAPEHKFPTWLDDTCEVTRQVLANKAAFGGDENTKVGVAGDSAGGAIAASVAHLVKGLAFQILIYAALDLSYDTPSCKEFTKPEHVLTPDLMAWSNANAYRTEEDKNDPRASVMRHETFDGVPPCQFIVAELDPLHDDSFNYRNKLEDAGIKTRLFVVKGVPHAFFTLPGIFKDACAQGVQTAKEFMESI